jgi:hypothetical protein
MRQGFFCAQKMGTICIGKYRKIGKSIVNYHPKIVQNQVSEDCLEVTYATETSRKSFLICIPPKTDEPPPLAIESFAMDPNHYHQLMERVEKMIKNDS